LEGEEEVEGKEEYASVSLEEMGAPAWGYYHVIHYAPSTQQYAWQQTMAVNAV